MVSASQLFKWWLVMELGAETETEVECLILNGKRSKLICSNCVIEGCSLSIEAQQEDVGKAS